MVSGKMMTWKCILLVFQVKMKLVATTCSLLEEFDAYWLLLPLENKLKFPFDANKVTFNSL